DPASAYLRVAAGCRSPVDRVSTGFLLGASMIKTCTIRHAAAYAPRYAAPVGQKWPDTWERLPVAFLDGDRRLHKMVEAFAGEWNQYSGLPFAFNAPISTAAVRVSFTPGGS